MDVVADLDPEGAVPPVAVVHLDGSVAAAEARVPACVRVVGEARGDGGVHGCCGTPSQCRACGRDDSAQTLEVGVGLCDPSVGVGEVLVEVGGRGVPGQVGLVAQDAGQQIAVGRHPADPARLQRGGELGGGVFATVGVGDDLGDHRVVVGGDLAALADPRVPADTAAAPGPEELQRAGDGEVVVGGVLGVEPHLDRMSGDRDVVLAQREPFAVGDQQLEPHQVPPRHLLGHGVLDLQTGVHLEEREVGDRTVVVGRGDELDRAGVDVADRLGCGDRSGTELGPQVVVDRR